MRANPSFIHYYKELINCESISSSDPKWDQSNQQIIDKLAQWFSDLGFDIEVIEVATGKYNLLAKRGQGKGGLLLAGHSDTVPFDQGRWDFDPHKLQAKNNRFYGLGTADMKGFFAFILEAITKLDWQNQKKPLYILATCDEETSMLGARHFSQSTLNANSPYQPEQCIIGEPTSLKPIRAHKGHIANAIRVTGKSGHSSDPALGINAIEIMNEIMVQLLHIRQLLISRYQHPGFAIPTPTLNLGHIHGGDSANRICGCCELHYDIRPLPGISLPALNELLLEQLKELQQKWPDRIEIIPLHQPIPGYECPADHPFITQMEQLTNHTSETVSYCTEAPFLQQVCPTLILGPGSIDQAHQPNEYLGFEYINPTIEILTKSINKFCF